MKGHRCHWKHICVPALALMLLGLALTLPRLGTSGLWDPWEPVYAQTAREMSERGDWVVPFHRGEPRINRPPVTYWLIGASHALFGVNEIAARLPSALLSVFCPVALCLAFAARGRPWEGFLGGAALLTSPQWLLLGRFATLSMPLASFLGLLLSLAIAWPALRSSRSRRLGLVAVIALLILATLTNWPRGLVLPAFAVLGWAALVRPRVGSAVLVAVAAAYHAGQLLYWPWLTVAAFVAAVGAALWFLASWGGVPARVLVGAVVVILLLLAPWFLAVGQVPGELKLMNYKYALNLGESPGDHTGPYTDVVLMLALGGLPWAAAALAGLFHALRRDADDVARMLGGTLIGTLLFFVLAESRMGHFTSVMQPALAALAAVGLARLVQRRDWTVVPVVLALSTLAFVVWDAPSRLLETATVRRSLAGLDPTPWVLAAMAAWAIIVGLACWRRRVDWALLTVLPAACLAGTLALWVVPALSAKKSTRSLWEAYVADQSGDPPLALVGRSAASVFYYSNNRVERIYEEHELRDFLDGPGTRYLIVSGDILKGLARRPASQRGRFSPIDRSHPTHTLLRFIPESREPAPTPADGSRGPG